MRSRFSILTVFSLSGLAFAACGPSDVVMDCSPYASPAQLAERPSPYDSIEVMIESSRIKLCYSRPYANGRPIFGGLVPWDTLWRTGANEPTIIHLSHDAEIAGLPVGRGKYSIYTVPSQTQWEVVVNAATGQWGQTRALALPDGSVGESSYTPEVEAQEVGRAPIETRTIDFVEQFTADFGDSSGGTVELYFDWEQERVVVPVRILGGD